MIFKGFSVTKNCLRLEKASFKKNLNFTSRYYSNRYCFTEKVLNFNVFINFSLQIRSKQVLSWELLYSRSVFGTPPNIYDVAFS